MKCEYLWPRDFSTKIWIKRVQLKLLHRTELQVSSLESKIFRFRKQNMFHFRLITTWWSVLTHNAKHVGICRIVMLTGRINVYKAAYVGLYTTVNCNFSNTTMSLKLPNFHEKRWEEMDDLETVTQLSICVFTTESDNSRSSNIQWKTRIQEICCERSIPRT